MEQNQEQLVSVLRDRKADLAARAQAAQTLAEFNDAQVSELLIDVLEGNGEEVRAAAITALQASAHIDRLLQWLAEGTPEQQIKAAGAFKYVWAEPARSLLEQALQSGQFDLRLAAVWALALHPAASSHKALAKALTDRELLVRVWAARGLEICVQKEDEPALITALDDEVEDVRISVAKALVRLNSMRSRTAINRRIAREPSYRVQKAFETLIKNNKMETELW